MAVVKGTNSGFVSTSPTADPAGLNNGQDNSAYAFLDTSPSTAAKITEVGWWCDNATQETNFEVGLYSADGSVVPGEAGTLLYSSTTNAKGTTSGWKKVTVDWTISPNTNYWIGLQIDDTSTTTNSNYSAATGYYDGLVATSLPNPFNQGTYFSGAVFSVYALWEAAAAIPVQINIADTFKTVESMQINIGDTWKDVSGASINVGDVWKTIF